MSAIGLASAFMLISKLGMIALVILVLIGSLPLFMDEQSLGKLKFRAKKWVLALFGVFRCKCKKGRKRAKYCFMGCSISSTYVLYIILCLGIVVLSFHVGASLFMLGAGYSLVSGITPTISYLVYNGLSFFLR
ncbi:hypothetical protein KAMAJI_00470 [Serratia phage vB_SmaM-Kamaji]|nr:hypothetical protein KAMAJI_00470 [Serratia phage vB_SmaM-Kamaji]